MSNRDTPQRPAGLSGQEEEDLRALEKGYDPEGGALPDGNLHDDPNRKPGDDAVPVASAAASARRRPDTGVLAPDQPKPVDDAEKRGLLPSSHVATPPVDRPDDTAQGPVDLDPDPARRRP
ncbi:hypothetical protein [Bordetella genomosp. 9]|uniref:Uncharacterized protein n=1 Tax=Bordetella genomosp. 9 TaxID=1416803 RepID=A0A1W6Z352_9BORD|nr:hypothetical protein [Bordetella genomosp. 9]ARP87681.1 hypothetical protein CAL13_16810 [Bordetella genomosp. 9]ARP91652.1 hypothetical protein CAL14_16285 [Bordetella genomosp. 9]